MSDHSFLTACLLSFGLVGCLSLLAAGLWYSETDHCQRMMWRLFRGW